MKNHTLYFVFLLYILSLKGYSQTDWTKLEYNPDIANIEHNPMKGWMPGYKGINSDFPYSIDHFYIRLSDVYMDWNTFDWTAFENELDRITNGGRHVVTRFWIYYPNQSSGLPSFLSGDVPLYSDGSPDWNDEDLMLAIEEFIAEFGSRYDGDERVAMIEAGLYGKWGEWHTFPENERAMTQANKDRILIAYQNAFDTTHIGLRQSGHASTHELKMSVGYYDDSFAYNTLCTGAWCSWNGNIVPDSITDNYIYHPFAGELRPQIQDNIFDAWPNATYSAEDDMIMEDLETCIRTTHLSYMKAFYLFGNIPTPTEWENAFRAHKMMGYEFSIDSVRLNSDLASNLTVDVKIQNNGVAPFYYNWDVEFAAIKSNEQYMGSIGKANWNINSILPDSGNYNKTFSAPIYGNDIYKILMRFVNPLENITENARELRFANSQQDADIEGWLTLGTVTVEAENVDVTDVVIENCPPDSITLGTKHLLIAIVNPYNATNRNVYWSSSDNSVATVDEYGEITALSKGSTFITLYSHDSTYSDQCIVNVKEPVITADEIVNVITPSQVSPGDSVTLVVEYTATQELDIRAFIQLNSPPWDTYGSKTITVSRGLGTLLIGFTTDPDIPLADNAYKFVVNLLPVGGSWPDRIDEVIIPDISAIMHVDSVSINNCLESDLPKGDTHQLSVTVSPSNAKDKSIVWSSSNTSVASVDENGLVRGLTDGKSNIIVTTNDGAFTDTCEITVATIHVSGVSLNSCPEAELVEGTTHQLTAAVTPDNANDKTITWSSSDTAIAKIDDNGLIQAISEGSATITVTTTDGPYTDLCTIIVIPVQVSGVSITNCPTDAIKKDSTHQLSVTVLPENAADKSINWSSSDTTIVTVSSEGLITGKSTGVAKILVETQNGGYIDSCQIIIEGDSGINNIDEANQNLDVKIYPNPASEIIHIDFPYSDDVEKQIKIFNIYGQLLLSTTTNESNVEINISNLKSGSLLIAQAMSGKRTRTFRIIIQNELE